MNPHGFAAPARLVSSDSPARRSPQTSSCSAGSRHNSRRTPRPRRSSSAKPASSSKNSTSNMASHGSSSSRSRSRAAAKARLPAGLVESRTVEVLDRHRAEIGELHRRLQRLHDRLEEENAEETTLGLGTTRRIAEVIPASVPSLPATSWVRSPGDRRARSRP